MRWRAEFLYQRLDQLRELRRAARKAVLREAPRQTAFKRLVAVPGLGPIRVAQIIAAIGSPYRFRSKRQVWAYCGFAVITRSSADYQVSGDKLERRPKQAQARGLNQSFSRRLKVAFKGAALEALKTEAFKKVDERLTSSGVRAEMARLTIARKLAVMVLAMWKSGEEYDETKLSKLAA